MQIASCPLCGRLAGSEVDEGSALAAALSDGFPVAEGHTLVLPRRHCADLFELTAEEYDAVLRLVRNVRDELAANLRPDGFTVGLNAGRAAGQTVPHAHVHVIPRFAGDVPDPRGGVRWVIPDRAAYWESGRQ